jgi:hypothetical protein
LPPVIATALFASPPILSTPAFADRPRHRAIAPRTSAWREDRRDRREDVRDRREDRRTRATSAAAAIAWKTSATGEDVRDRREDVRDRRKIAAIAATIERRRGRRFAHAGAGRLTRGPARIIELGRRPASRLGHEHPGPTPSAHHDRTAIARLGPVPRGPHQRLARIPPSSCSPDGGRQHGIKVVGIAGVQARDPACRPSPAVLKGLAFTNGTIEVDVEGTTGLGPSIGFHRRDAGTYELFYVRPNPDCPKKPDCVQYAPVTTNVLLWDLPCQRPAAT